MDKETENLHNSIISQLEVVRENLEGAAELMQDMQKSRSYGHLTTLRMGIYRQRNVLKVICDVVKNFNK